MRRDSGVAIVTKVGTVDELSLAPMAVMPEHQRQGIGSTKQGEEYRQAN